ncbi:hypothetical protein HW555_002299 [Spodoptera exigua]|uniref:Uncharacterized protein n=1 Tax=Spodoptera exigua TaxID=7107 RepID=A0A835GR37_SPOEX|nr:hypothetical protein HW555_002299 [Spodoptera exigua]
MEALHGTLAELRSEFRERMSKFEADLNKTPSVASGGASSGLVQDYAAFKRFTFDALECIQRQMEFFARDLDALEMRGRRKILLFHGVPETTKEITAVVVANVIKDKLSMDTFTTSDIRRCHRVGSLTSKTRPRPILVKMQDMGIRDRVWYSKTKLKGTGITLSEFLTKARHQVFMAARDKFGVSNCWTKQGHIHVLGPDGARHRLLSLSDLRAIGEPATILSGLPRWSRGRSAVQIKSDFMHLLRSAGGWTLE